MLKQYMLRFKHVWTHDVTVQPPKFKQYNAMHHTRLDDTRSNRIQMTIARLNLTHKQQTHNH